MLLDSCIENMLSNDIRYTYRLYDIVQIEVCIYGYVYGYMYGYSIGPIHKNVSGKRFINYNRLIILPFILSISFCTSFGRIKFVSFQGSRIPLKISAQNSMLRICETFSFIFCWRRVTVDFPNKMTDYIPMKKHFCIGSLEDYRGI